MGSFCAGCGNSLSNADTFCAICGRSVSATSAIPQLDPGIAFGLAPETSGKAIFSLICGIFGIFPPAAIVAVIFGHLSMSEIRRSAGRLTGKGLAIAGLVLGYLGVVFLVGIVIFAAFSVSKVVKATRSVNETSAVASLRTLNTAEIAYTQAHPEAGYTCSFSELAGAWGISGELAHGKKGGYAFALQDCTSKIPGGPITKYQVVAYPTMENQLGKAVFCSNESARIKVSRSGSSQACLKSGEDLPANQM